MSTMTPTPEQQAFLDAVDTGRGIVCQAGAGAGKTTIARAAAHRLVAKGQSGIYTAFNRAIVDAARGKFPREVAPRTTYSIAFQAHGHPWKPRLDMRGQSLRDVATILRIREPIHLGKDIAPLSVGKVARLALATVTGYCESADEELSARHVPELAGVEGDTQKALADAVLGYARRAWADMADATGGKLAVKHNVYFKSWALTHPQIDADFIFVDECQDTDAVLAAVLREQKMPMYLIGDDAQMIYCQPEGTAVEVPILDEPEFSPHLPRCAFNRCPRQRIWRLSGLCGPHERQRVDGRELTAVELRPTARAKRTRQVPIESLRVGDRVLTYGDRKVWSTGRKITNITRIRHQGELVRATVAGGETSRYTPRHHCVVRIGDELQGKHVVYLMRRGDQFRVGRVPVYYGSAGNGFGPGIRAAQEHADALWILSVHDSAAEVAHAEALAQARYGIPGLRFEPTGPKDLIDVHRFWRELGPNREAAQACLRAFGRLIEHPLWTGGPKNPIGVRRTITTAAANLIDGMRMLPLRGAEPYPGKSELMAPIQAWEAITVSRESYDGDVISLEVDDHHTYFADGLLTHNSWRGCISIMDDFPAYHQLALTRSFRFGPSVADEANKWLDLIDAKIRITGHDPVQSIVGPLDTPEAILCRTNAGAVAEAIDAIGAGRKVHLKGAGDEVKAIVQAAETLMAGQETWHPELQAFRSWDQVKQYVEDGLASTDLESAVRLIDTHGVDEVAAALAGTVGESYADVVVTTCHKVKGLEWDQVRIGSDWHAPRRDADVPETTAMLAYVAVTRAKTHLDRGGLAWVDRYVDAPAPVEVPAPAAPAEAPRVLLSPREQAAVEALRAAQVHATSPGYDDAARADDMRRIVAAYLDQRSPVVA